MQKWDNLCLELLPLIFKKTPELVKQPWLSLCKCVQSFPEPYSQVADNDSIVSIELDHTLLVGAFCEDIVLRVVQNVATKEGITDSVRNLMTTSTTPTSSLVVVPAQCWWLQSDLSHISWFVTQVPGT